MKRLLLLLLFAASALRADDWVFNPRFEQVSPLWRRDLDSNLRWMVAREAKGEPGAEVGVYADAGAWFIGTRAVVEALESAGVPCRLLDHSLLTPQGLSGLKAIVVPGGDAYCEEIGAGHSGLTAIREFVKGGGTYLGICAGAYLASAEVSWEGKRYPYMLRLFNGAAEDSVPGTPDFPRAGSVELAITEQGQRRGLGPLAARPLYYQGGCCFRHCGDAAVLALYADKSPAIIEKAFGKGRVVLTGVHLERPAPAETNRWAAPPAAAGRWLLALLGLKADLLAYRPAGLYNKAFAPVSDNGANQKELMEIERQLRAELECRRH